MPATLRDHLLNDLRDMTALFLKDIEAMSPEVLARSPGGDARRPYDFIYEVAMINRRVATRLRGESVPKMDFTKWTTAPDEFCDKERIKAEVQASLDEACTAFAAIPDEALDKEIPTPAGTTTPIQAFALLPKHVTYHDAQLNYVQAMSGDTAMHWF